MQEITGFSMIYGGNRADCGSSCPPGLRGCWEAGCLAAGRGRSTAEQKVYQIRQVDRIDRVESADYYVEIHAGNDRHLIKESMNWMESHLDPSLFVRIHRSSIVALDRILRVHDIGDGAFEVEMRDGVRLPVSRRRRRGLERALGKSF